MIWAWGRLKRECRTSLEPSPASLEVTAENEFSNEPDLPPGCDRECRFPTFRLEDRESEEYQKLTELFFGPESTTYCIDFYMRGTGLIYQGSPYSCPKLVVSDNSLTVGGYSPVLYMSHSDHLLADDHPYDPYQDDRYDDHSVAISCYITYPIGNALFYGDARRGCYSPYCGKLNVFDDVKLGGIGRLLLEPSQGGCEFIAPVQSEADLFVINCHGGPPEPGRPYPIFGPFFERLDDGQASPDCNFDARPRDLTGFNADADWLAMLSCGQMAEDSIRYYYDELIATGKLYNVGGYRALTNSGVMRLMADDFNETLNNFQDYRYHLWGDPAGGGKFIAAWMEAHCQLAKNTLSLAEKAAMARAIDSDYKYWIRRIPEHRIWWGLRTVRETFKIQKEAF